MGFSLELPVKGSIARQSTPRMAVSARTSSLTCVKDGWDGALAREQLLHLRRTAVEQHVPYWRACLLRVWGEEQRRGICVLFAIRKHCRLLCQRRKAEHRARRLRPGPNFDASRTKPPSHLAASWEPSAVSAKAIEKRAFEAPLTSSGGRSC
eukprot:3080922-Rhodomonas_salina.1